jgi:hypothetical protein
MMGFTSIRLRDRDYAASAVATIRHAQDVVFEAT